jgi:transcription antitermination factor NusG
VRCHWWRDPETGIRHRIPGCEGAAIIGEHACTCPPRKRHPDEMELIERVRKLEKAVAKLTKKFATAPKARRNPPPPLAPPPSRTAINPIRSARRMAITPNVLDGASRKSVTSVRPSSLIQPFSPRNLGAEFAAVGRPLVAETPEITLVTDLFDTVDPWYAVRVQGRREERFVALMVANGIPVFYPTMVVRERERRREPGRRHEHRYAKVRRPLWRGYCFIAADDDGIYAAKSTNIIYTILPAKDQSRLRSSLRSISDWVGRDDPMERYIRPGSRCRVTGGAFENFEGTWVAQKGGRGHLLCTFAGQAGTPLNVDIELLEPL